MAGGLSSRLMAQGNPRVFNAGEDRRSRISPAQTVLETHREESTCYYYSERRQQKFLALPSRITIRRCGHLSRPPVWSNFLSVPPSRQKKPTDRSFLADARHGMKR